MTRWRHVEAAAIRAGWIIMPDTCARHTRRYAHRLRLANRLFRVAGSSVTVTGTPTTVKDTP